MLAPNKFYDFLLIDDVGEEPREASHYGNGILLFPLIVERRYDAQLPIIITTNLRFPKGGEKSVESVYGERVADRLKEMCNVFILKGNSYHEKI